MTPGPSSADHRWELVVPREEGADLRLPVPSDGSLLVGRDEDCDVRLEDDGVSRHHARLRAGEEGVRITDLGSTNGTSVDGREIESATLERSGSVAFGPVEAGLRRRAASRGPEGPSAPRSGAGGTRVAMAADPVETVSRRVVDGRLVAPDEAEADEGAGSRLWLAYRVSHALARSSDLEQAFREVLEAVFRATSAERVALLAPPSGATTGEAEEELVVWAAASQDGDEDEIQVSRTVVEDVVTNGVSVLSRDATADERYEDAESVVMGDIRSVACAPLASDEGVLGAIYADSRSVAGALTDEDLELLSLIGNEAGAALRRQRLVAEREQSFLDAVRAVVATVDAKDGYTHRHSERVAAVAARLAREAGWEVEDESLILLAGLVHDVGKIAVPDAILNKEGGLTDEEFGRMQEHAARGDEILAQTESERFQAVRPAVRHHHERWDGSGYPDGLAGEQIPRLGRVLAVADVIDALTSDRSYRDPMPLSEAVEVVREGAGSHFDPALARAAGALHERGELDPSSEEVDRFLRGGNAGAAGAPVRADEG